MRKTTEWQRAQASKAMRFDACSVQQIIAAHYLPNRGECAAASLTQDIRLHIFRWKTRWQQDSLITKSAHLRDRLAKR